MDRLRVTAVALTVFAGVLGGCEDTGRAEPLAPETMHRNNVITTNVTAGGGGWVGSGRESAIASDSTTSRGGGWVGSGH
jgi:hypothetical protein